jgi:thiamine-monophosphate kinase
MPTLSDIGEFGLIARIARLAPSAPTVVEGIGDDCAVVRVFDRLLLVSCDLFVENIHFRRAQATPESIGWKAATSSLSDIAAMGGAPLFCLVSLACPPDTEVGFIEAVYHGLVDAVSQWGAVVVGGDTTRSPDGLVLDVMVIGETIGNRYVSRRGAQPGDVLAVTGLLGLSAAGRSALERGKEAPALIRAHGRPSARISEGQWFSACVQVHALIDVSDGLVQDAGHLAEAAKIGVDIDPTRLLVDPELGRYCAAQQLDPYEFILTGGEDYELVFALDANNCEETLRGFRREFHTEICTIGAFSDAWHGVRVAGRTPMHRGFNHFKP